MNVTHQRQSRRTFMTAFAAAAAVSVGVHRTAAGWQRVRRIGLLLGDDAAAGDAFEEELARLGYGGDRIQIDKRVLGGGRSGLQTIADLARSNSDLLIVAALPIALEVRRLNQTVPLVVVTGPALSCTFGLESCPAPALAQKTATVPRDRRVTGIDELPPGVTSKRLSLLKTAFPRVRRIALLSTTPGIGGHEIQLADAEQEARRLDVTVRAYRAASVAQLEEAFTRIVADGNEGLANFQGGLSFVNRGLIIAFAAKHGLPAIYQATAFPESGGLMAWAPDLRDQFRQAADYAARILGGASPEDLPIRHPSKYYFVVNAAAAKAFGMPPDVLAQADRVVS